MFKTILNKETIEETIECFKDFFDDMDEEKAIDIINSKIEKQKGTVYEADKTWIDNYIMFGGKGLLDGIVSNPTKQNFYKAMDVNENGLIVKRYRARATCTLPIVNFDQKYVLISENEYKKLSK